ncbi:MAG: hypothetical protein E2O76_18425 [Caldithrix sp.]|nr:MAG: hypothetical protein E2O76_18425 [Caldithrix sp.]
MLTNRVLFVILFSLAIPLSNAAESFEITSAKAVSFKDGKLYVSAGYPRNHEGFQSQLKRIWNNSNAPIQNDSYDQKWKEVSIDQIEAVYGQIDKLYFTIFGDEIQKHEALKARIFEWGCEGSLIPILDLGYHRFNDTPREWGVGAIGVSTLEVNPELHRLEEALIPKDFYGNGQYPGGWELWINGVKRFSYVARRQAHNPEPENLVIDHLSGEVRKIVERSPFDVRC